MISILKVFFMQAILFCSFYFGVVLGDENIENIFIGLVSVMIILSTISMLISGSESFKKEVLKSKGNNTLKLIAFSLSVVLSISMMYYGYVFSGLWFLLTISVLRAARIQIESTPNNPA